MKGKIKRALLYIFKGVQPKNISANIIISAPSSLLKGKNIIITGGSRGLGFIIAKLCIEKGANVLITGRKEETLIKACEQLSNCNYIVNDVNNIMSIQSFFDEAEKIIGGPIHCLVNNAGISLHEGSISNVTCDSFDAQINTNLKGPYFLSQEFIKRYIANNLNCGSIIFITSERGLYCDDIPYGIIKAAINSLTQGLGRRFINKGLRVNAVAPGVTASDMTGYHKDGNLYRSSACGERVYLPEEVAETVVFLLSDLSGCTSSQIIACNRGNHLRCDF